MAARFKKSMPQQRAVPVAPNWTEISNPLPPSPPRPQQPKMDMLDKGSSALWNILSALGGMVKQDVNMLKSDPIGSLKATADSWTVGQEARDRFKQGDYAGAITNSGAGSMLAMPELQNIISGKGKPADLAWLAATYGTGPISKVVKGGKAALNTGSKKAYINVLSRLSKP
jgi:hypothetical protein